jgi:hypothetical protein
MIKIFRKIRRALLTENKYSKYLLYAIGEIVLVVIGILVALNVNNGNENKKQRVQEIQVLKEIKSELDFVLFDIKEDLIGHNRGLTSAEVIYNATLNQEDYHDSLKAHYINIIAKEDFLASTSAFESLQSLGLEIISNDSIRDALIRVYLYIDKAAKDHTVSESIEALEITLEPHIRLDRARLKSDTARTWINTWEIPYAFIDYESFQNDDKFLYALIDLIKMRRLRLFLYGQYQKGLEYHIHNIEMEINALEK